MSFTCLFLYKLVTTVRKPCLTTREKGRLVALNRGRKNLFIIPARKAPLVELKPTGPHEASKPASLNDLVKATTQAFKLSVAYKPSTSTSDPIGRNISLKQPNPYSLGQNLMLWLSEFEKYFKLADITEQKTKAFMITWLLCRSSRQYRAV